MTSLVMNLYIETKNDVSGVVIDNKNHKSENNCNNNSNSIYCYVNAYNAFSSKLFLNALPKADYF